MRYQVLSLIASLLIGSGAAGQTPVAVLPSIPSTEDVTEEAKNRAMKADAEARRAWQAGNMKVAQKAAEEAFEAVPNASTALIRAAILGRAGRHREAFEAFLQASDLDPTGEERALIDEGLVARGAACDPPMGWVRFDVDPQGAEVETGGVKFAAPRTVGLPEGTHEVRVTAHGRTTQETRVSIGSGAGTVARFTLVAGVAPPPNVPAVVVSKPQPRKRPIWPWFVAGGGAACLGVAAGMHIWALSGARDANSYASPVEGMSEEERRRAYDGARSKVNTRKTIAYALYGVGGAALVTGTVFLIVNSRKGASALQMMPAPAPGGGFLSLSGGF